MARERNHAVVIGAGPNGLVAANVLADAGWSVQVLEAQPEIGGAVRSDRELDPEFVHDTFSAFYPLGAASPVLKAMDLERYGVRWRHAPAVLGHALPDGRWALLHRDRDVTAAGLDAAHPGDGEAWLELAETWDRIGDPILQAMLTPFPPVRGGARAATAVLRTGGVDLVRTLVAPAMATLQERFAGELPRLLVAGNAGHADIPLTAPGSTLFGLLLAMLGQTVGFPVPEGGAGRLTEALALRLQERGGTIACDQEVVRIDVEGGGVSGVRTADGARHPARRVLADVAFPTLFGRLVSPEDLPRRVRRGLPGFRLDPGTVKVDWALDGPVPWASAPAYAPGTVHIADSLGEMDQVLTQLSAGVIPAKPFMLVGQMTTSDPSRSPAGTESLWAYAHVPQPGSGVSDGGDGSVLGRWDHDDRERFADRMQARLERVAPGFGSRIRARRVLGPVEMEQRDANLIGGALGGGTAQVDQELFFRPVAGMLGRASTGIPGLYLASSAAHPGGGVHGACGANAARAALFRARLGRQ